MLEPTPVTEGILSVPVRLEIRTSTYPAVVEAFAPANTHPFVNCGVEVARVTNTVSVETTPVTAQKYT